MKSKDEDGKDIKAGDIIYIKGNTFSRWLEIESIAIGIHPDELSYYKSVDPSMKGYDEENHETIYLTNGCYISVDTLWPVNRYHGDSSIEGREEAIFETDVEISLMPISKKLFNWLDKRLPKKHWKELHQNMLSPIDRQDVGMLAYRQC